MKIPEIEAKDILLTYIGFNNQILEWKRRLEGPNRFKLTRPQAEYILKHHKTVPKIARKYVNINGNYAEKLMDQRQLTSPPKRVWVEKLLCESDKAFNVWGRIFETERFFPFWIPKHSVIPEVKKLKYEVDYTPYDLPDRDVMSHQKTAVESLLANDKFILADDMGLGKMEFVDNQIFTPFGRKRIGDSKIGDLVIGSDGKQYNIIGVFPQGFKKTYKITFNDGYSLICGGEHLWKVYSNNFGENTKNNREEKEIVLTTEQMLDKNLELEINGIGHNKNKKYNFKTYYKVKNGDSKWQIPIVKPIKFQNNYKLPIDPYLLGLSLGDGHIDNISITFHVHKDDYEELFQNFNIKENRNFENVRKGRINLKEEIQSLKINNTHSWDKFIPEIYKYSSIEDRLSILQGLMDTDGHCMKSKNGNFNGTEYCTISEQLADDVAEIVHSLGGIVRKSSRIPTYIYKGEKKKGRKAYRLNIKLLEGMNPFRLERKRILYNEPKKYPIGRYIKTIEPCGEHECVCISVDSPDKLYVTEHAIVTHNTTSSIIASIESKPKKVLVICPASLKINWKREIEMYSDKRIFIVEGRKWGTTFDYYIINFEILKNYHTLDEEESDEEKGMTDDIKLIEDMKFDLAIIDEAHMISKVTAKRTQIVNDIVKNIPKVWLLTGTPMTSRPMDFFNLLKIVGSPITLNWQTYARRYCNGFRFFNGTKKVWSTNGATNLKELRESTQNVILRRLKEDTLDLPDKIIAPIFLELNNKFYNEEYTEFLKISKQEKKKENITITLNRLMRARQIIATEKVPYTCELIDKFLEQDKKVIVFTNFTQTLHTLHEKYKGKSVILDGKMNLTQKQASIDKFQNTKKIKVFIANLKAGGVGHNLTAAEGVIMNDLCFVPSDHSQGEDRAFRIGQKKNVLVYYPIFENTIDLIVYNILKKKKSNIDEVLGDGEFSLTFEQELLKELL